MNNRNRIILFGFVGVVVLIAVTFPLWRPLFVNDVVDEAFPGLTAGQRDAVRAMSQEQRDMLVQMAEENREMAEQTAGAMTEGDTEVDEAMEEEPVARVSGAFGAFDAVHNGEGTATIYELPDGSRVLRLENFRVTNGPDLHVVLSSVQPTTILESLGDDHIDLGQLKGNVGNQNYDIPDDVDIAQFSNVIIYCQPFHVNFSVAPLS